MSVTIIQQPQVFSQVEKLKSGKVTEIVSEENIPVEEDIEVEDNPAEVNVEIGFTKNLGDYQSLRVTVGVRVPCANNPTSIDQAADWGKDFCDNKIQSILEDDEGGDGEG